MDDKMSLLFFNLENLQKEVSVLLESIEGRQFMAHANSILEGEEATRDGGAQVRNQCCSSAILKMKMNLAQISFVKCKYLMF